MLSKKNKNHPIDKRELRKFGFTLAMVLSIWGGIFFWRGKTQFPIFFVLSALIFASSLIKPVILLLLRKIFMKLAEIISAIITNLVLGIVFYGVFTLIGFAARLCGKQFLDIDFEDNKDSYWKKREQKKVSPESYEKQF